MQLLFYWVVAEPRDLVDCNSEYMWMSSAFFVSLCCMSHLTLPQNIWTPHWRSSEQVSSSKYSPAQKQGNFSLLIYSIIYSDSVSEQGRPRSDCANAQSDLVLRSLHMPWIKSHFRLVRVVVHRYHNLPKYSVAFGTCGSYLYCVQAHSFQLPISGVVRWCECVSYVTGASSWYSLTVGQGLLSL